MKRRKFIALAGGTLVAAGATSYGFSDKSNLSRADLAPSSEETDLLPDEQAILSLASLAPSGHNTQPWLVQRLEPLHWIVGNDKTRWLPAVDPTQRETMLSIGAFACNLELAASSLGYFCTSELKAKTNQDQQVMKIQLRKTGAKSAFDTAQILQRRTVWSHFLADALKKEDVAALIGSEDRFIHYFPNDSKESRFLNEQTLEANQIQSLRDPAQRELAQWIRFSSRDAATHRDGLTPAGMEIEGIAGWIVRNFYGAGDVMKPDFRDKNIEKVRGEVARHAGWILITSKDGSVASLLETGAQLQKLWLKVRGRGIAIHPMTQILEESSTRQNLNSSIGLRDPIQFILRIGYVPNYPAPVSLRRPVGWFLRS